VTHLSESEFVDLVEEALDPRRARHVETCASCRERADTLRDLLRQTSSVIVPDPSPLFWDHLSARVREAVAAAPAPDRSGWSWPRMRILIPMGAAAAVMVAVISGTLMLRPVRSGNTPVLVVSDHGVAPASSDPRTGAAPDADNAEVWDVLTSAASTVGFDEAHAVGMHVHPAAIDDAVRDLSAAELSELGRLLQSELKRSSN
jgi:hypothetical protein